MPCSICRQAGHTKRSCPRLFAVTLSEEQRRVQETISRGTHVVVEAVAGSGKTTTMIETVRSLSDKRVLMLYYNRRAADDAAQRLKRQGVDDRCVAKTLDGAAWKYYGSGDKGRAKEVVDSDSPLLNTQFVPELVIIDEAQDLSWTKVSFVLKLLRDLNIETCQLVLVGDRYQCINECFGASEIFIAEPQSIFDTSRPWIRTSLSTSYRCPSSICDFVNVSLRSPQRMEPCDGREACNVTYMYLNARTCASDIANEILRLKSEQGYTDEDFMVVIRDKKKDRGIAPCDMCTALTRNGCMIEWTDTADDKTIKGKVWFTTPNRAKGLERKVVFVYGFDEFWWMMEKKKNPSKRFSNVTYVSCTRAKERLYVIHDNSYNSPSPSYFVPSPCISLFPNSLRWGNVRLEGEVVLPTHVRKTVTNLMEQATDEKLEIAVDFFDVEVIHEASYHVRLPQTVKVSHQGVEYVENISAINGLGIPCLAQFTMQRKLNLLEEMVRKRIPFIKCRSCLPRYDSVVESIQREPHISLMLELVTLVDATFGIEAKVKQLVDYDWLNDVDIERCTEFLQSLIPTEAFFEHPLEEREIDVRGLSFSIRGRADCITHDTMWEFKCTETIENRHLVQLAIYAWMDRLRRDHYRLVHVTTGKVLEISSSRERLEKMMKALLK